MQEHGFEFSAMSNRLRNVMSETDVMHLVENSFGKLSTLVLLTIFIKVLVQLVVKTQQQNVCRFLGSN